MAGLRLRFLDLPAPRAEAAYTVPCRATLAKGEEMGWFEHGSTIVVLAPRGFTLAEGVAEGAAIRVGQALMRAPAGG